MEGKIVLSIADLREMGFSRTMAYALLNRADLPVVKIGGRKFMHAEKFEQWLAEQAVNSKSV